MPNWKKYDYHENDKELGFNVHFYEDLMKIAKMHSRVCVVDCIRFLHEKHKGNARRIADIMGVHRMTAIKWFRRLGLEVGKRGGYPFETHPLWIHLRTMEPSELKGKIPTLAKQWGISKFTVYNWLRQDRARKEAKCNKI